MEDHSKQHQLESLNEELTTPHFDESAIAAAQPVQPLPHRTWSTFDLRQAPRHAAAVGSAIVLLIGLGVWLSDATAQHDDRAPGISMTEARVEAESIPEANQPDPEPVDERRAPRRYRRLDPRDQITFQRIIMEPGKPVARKVGEIRSRY
jgi:hypothetical protein